MSIGPAACNEADVGGIVSAHRKKKNRKKKKCHIKKKKIQCPLSRARKREKVKMALASQQAPRGVPS